ncbi:hypothetical protein SJAV_24600 [Sulfurisphaera javensis]|uniref:Uncharacterized protein n=1 Tax=Sulfurisphaera javensis TaxID=2049879 RepID=A0AAT9GV66_9CREN
MDDIVQRFLKEEEAVIKINENEINIEYLDNNIPIGVRIILVGKDRKRLIDLGILSFIYKYCEKGKEFAKDYINLSISLEDIYFKYRVYTELEFLSLCESKEKNNLHKDLLYTLNKLKSYLISKNKR